MRASIAYGIGALNEEMCEMQMHKMRAHFHIIAAICAPARLPRKCRK